MSNSKELNPVRSIPPQQPLPNNADASRMVLNPSEKAWLPPAVALVSVIWRAPPEFASVALVLPAPKFLNQSCVPTGHVYSTPGVCALTFGRNKLRLASARKIVNHRSDFIRAPPPVNYLSEPSEARRN